MDSVYDFAFEACHLPTCPECHKPKSLQSQMHRPHVTNSAPFLRVRHALGGSWRSLLVALSPVSPSDNLAATSTTTVDYNISRVCLQTFEVYAAIVDSSYIDCSDREARLFLRKENEPRPS